MSAVSELELEPELKLELELKLSLAAAWPANGAHICMGQ